MRRSLAAALLALAPVAAAEPQPCGAKGVAVQVLGSGGPEMQDKRASTSYLVWQDGVPRVLVDAGGGSALRFGESGATMTPLDVILFSHFHVDHSGDFAALVKSSWFEDRTRPLPVYGPRGNDFMPSTTEFVADLFGGERGAYRYLSDLYEPKERGSYKLEPHDVTGDTPKSAAFRSKDLSAFPARVVHGGVPALAWRVELENAVIVFSGDTSGEGGLAGLASGADLFVAHNAVPEGATGFERKLHMPPSVIGRIAADARVKHLVLSHRMLRTLGREDQTRTEIRKTYSGPMQFADDLDCFPVP
ncbi:MAG TPA: MBL fold metallo-hydrolase [Thermoanaerobaculia bacterium]|nr:MBL fold metallo-hydrolase [Thermoanaerobaculia bacterium]